MIKIVCGDDRARAEKWVKRQLPEQYEVVEGAELTLDQLVNIMKGNTLFDDKRNVLIKDFGENGDVFGRIVDYKDTKNNIIRWKSKLDKRTSTYKKFKDAGVEINEYKMVEQVRNNEVFDVFELAVKGNGIKAVKLIEKIQKDQDAYSFVGLMVTQAIKRYDTKQGMKEKIILKKLAELDIQTKSSQIEPWELVKIFILQISQF